MKRPAILLGAFALLVLPSLLGTHHSPRAAAQDDEKKVKLRWYGQSMFQLETSSGKLVVFDPHIIPVFAPPRLTADVTLVSHPHNDHDQVDTLKAKGRDFYGVKNVGKGVKQEWNAIDEAIGAIKIRTLGTFHDAVNGMQRGKNSIWIVEVDGLTFVHLGDLGHELTEAQAKTIGKVDVLMVPVGGIFTINGDQAKATVKLLKPRLYVIPMHYGVPEYDDIQGPDEFLGGQKNVKKMLDTNEMVIPVDMKADAPTVVMLGWKVKEKKKEPEKK
jgi:L-ascorbate metabolism protein UlaG (beta-lactamase superfamily)